MKFEIEENKKFYKEDFQGIYSITFDNGKRYIGLSNQVKRRCYEHTLDKNRGDLLPVHKAMNTHNYYFELLENCNNLSRKELCEREKYWIKYYETTNKEKGYNLTLGGDGGSPGCFNSSSKFNEQQINEIYDLLINHPEIYIYQIAEKFKISPEAISNINLGNRYFNKELNYPLRKRPNVPVESGCKNHLAKFDEKTLENIIKDLKHSSLTLEKLAKKYECSYATIQFINSGERYFNKEISYPIRKEKRSLKLSYEQIAEVYYDLLYTKESLKKIGSKFNVCQDVIINLNKGKTFQREVFEYPLRENIEFNQEVVSTISEIGRV